MAKPNLTFLRTGSGDRTPVLLIHGFTGDSQSWRLVAPMLAQRRQVLSLDLPCHGTSPLIQPQSFSHFVETTAEAITKQGLTDFHLVGHSLGGAVVFALADLMAGQVRSLCAVAPAGLAEEVDGAFINEYVTTTDAQNIERCLQRIVGQAFQLPEGLAELIAEKRNDPARIAAQAAIGRMFFPEGVQTVDVTDQMRNVSVPSKIIWGKQDTLIPWHHGLKAPPQIGLHFLAGVGHMPPLEAPETLAGLISEAIAASEGA